MQKKALKWGVSLFAAGIIGAALVTANMANAQDNSGSSASSKEINFLAILLSLFAFPNEDYNKYIKNERMPINSRVMLTNAVVNKWATSDTLGFLEGQSLYVKSVLDTQQHYAGEVPASEEDAQKHATSFNAGTLLNTYQLDNNAIIHAQTYINFLADAGNPIASPTKNLATSSSSAATSYVNSFGTYNAQLSTALNILYRLKNERLPSGNSPFFGGESPLKYDADAASSRMQSAWLTKITGSKFTPADATRESLVIAAEQRYELFQIRMQLESLNTLIASMQLQQLATVTKPLLRIQETRALQSTRPSNN